MRILIVNMYYYPNMIGGAEHSVKLLAEGLSKADQEVAVLTLDGSSRNLAKDFVNGVSIYRGYSKSIYRRRILNDKSHVFDAVFNGINSIYNHQIKKIIKNVINDFNPDIIHTNNLVSMSYWIWKYSYKHDIPLIHTLRDYWLIDPTTRIDGSNKFLMKLFQCYMRHYSNEYVRVVTAPSEATLSIFSQRKYFQNASKSCIVNCIDFSQEVLESVTHKKLNKDGSIVSFLFAGYLSENKGVKYLINELKDTDCDFRIVFCGNGPLLDELQAYSKKDTRVVVKGKVTKSELNKEYEKNDVLVMPSLWEEPFGRTVIEAAQFAMPTIGSDKGGIPETITTLSYGETVSVEQSGVMARCLEKYSNRDYVKQIIRAMPQNIQKYTAEEQINGFLSLYKKTIDKVGDRR